MEHKAELKMEHINKASFLSELYFAIKSIE